MERKFLFGLVASALSLCAFGQTVTLSSSLGTTKAGVRFIRNSDSAVLQSHSTVNLAPSAPSEAYAESTKSDGPSDPVSFYGTANSYFGNINDPDKIHFWSTASAFARTPNSGYHTLAEGIAEYEATFTVNRTGTYYLRGNFAANDALAAYRIANGIHPESSYLEVNGVRASEANPLVAINLVAGQKNKLKSVTSVTNSGQLPGFQNEGWAYCTEYTVSTVPEPASMAVLALGMIGLARKRRK